MNSHNDEVVDTKNDYLSGERVSGAQVNGVRGEHYCGGEYVSDVRVSAVRVEHYSGDVLGIAHTSPRLSWDYEGIPMQGDRVLVSVVREGVEVARTQDSVELPAQSHVLVDWPFDPLAPREEARLSVQLVGSDAQPAAVRVESSMAAWELNADFVGPAWSDPETDHRHLPLVRTEINVLGKPVRARLYLSALGLVEAHINGHTVGEDVLNPGWTVYRDRVEQWVYDVTDMLHEGTNALGFLLGDGWWRGRLGFDGGIPNVYGDRIGVQAQLEVRLDNGQVLKFYSNAWDETWHAARGPIVRSDLYEGETYDARLEQKGWDEPGFDETTTQGTIGQWDPVAEVVYDQYKVKPASKEAVRAQGENHPVSISKQADGTYLLDFGQNCSQLINLHMKGLKTGDVVELRHAEVLDSDGSLATRTLRRGQQHDTYISNGQDAWWQPRFVMHGFRYATISGYPGELTADNLVCSVYHTTMRRTGWFNSSNTLLNRLHSNALWSMKSNFVSLPTDCPQRDERMGWTGDIDLFAPTASYLYDVHNILGSWLTDVRSEQLNCGTVPFFVPFVPLGVWAKPEAIAIWGDAVVAVPWAIYMDDGDTQLLEQSWDLIHDWIAEVEGYLSSDGVWDRKPRYPLGQLGDWLDPSAPPEDPTQAITQKELVATAFFARSCKQASYIAAALGKGEEEEHYASLYERIRTGYIARFVQRNDHTGLRMTSDTQCAYALSIAFGLFEGSERLVAAAGERLANLVRESGGKVSTGFAGTPYVLPALSATGHIQEAYSLLLSTQCPSWLYQVAMGATTTWERWDSLLPDGSINPGGMTSFNHYALGSVAQWLHTGIGGLESLEPGWKRFAVNPFVGGGLDHASTAHITPFGQARVDWKINDDGSAVDVHVEVPYGSTAVVPALDGKELTAGEHNIKIKLS